MGSTRSRRAALLDGPAPPRVRIAPAAPSGANSWEDVADLASTLGFPLDEWQEQALEAAMGERSDGRWASKFVGISAPRQNGKSQLIVARALAGVLLFGEKTIIISAHETDTAREIWRRMIDVIEDNPTLEARVTARMNAVNRESLTFGDGLDKQTIKLKARGLSGSRGFSADCLLLDEAQILGKQAWGSIVPTMSARPNPQLWLFGTPPTERDEPFAFARVRESATHGKARHCWLEWSAEPGDDIDSPETWAKANPSYGVRISHEACADDRAAMDDEQFGLERLGKWPDLDGSAADVFRPFSTEGWATTARDAHPTGPPRFFLTVAKNLQYAFVAASAEHDGVPHIGVADYRPGVSWLSARVKDLHARHPQASFGAYSAGPVKSWAPQLAEFGVELELLTGTESPLAYAHLKKLVDDVAVTHSPADVLSDSLAGAVWREVEGGGFTLDWRKSQDPAPIAAAAGALWLLESVQQHGEPSVYVF
jgi:hypothetical protein